MFDGIMWLTIDQLGLKYSPVSIKKSLRPSLYGSRFQQGIVSSTTT